MRYSAGEIKTLSRRWQVCKRWRKHTFGFFDQTGFVPQLKAERHHESEHTFEERFAIAKQMEVRRFTLEIDSDGTVVAGLAGSVTHGHPSVIRSRKLMTDHGGNALKSQDHREGLRGLPLKAMECGRFLPKYMLLFSHTGMVSLEAAKSFSLL
jgi:hypothetical protein